MDKRLEFIREIAEENCRIILEFYGCSCFIGICLADDFYLCLWNSALITLEVELTVETNYDFAPFRKCVNGTYANTMQTARNFVSSPTKLTARVKLSHYNFQCRHACLGMGVNRYTASVILHCYTFISVNNNIDFITVPRQCFVNCIVYNLINEVV